MTAEGVLVVVDATNVWRSDAWAAATAGAPAEISVQRLVDVCASWAAAAGAHVVLVFDGQAPAGAAPQCEVVGSGPRTADDVVEERCTRAREQRIRHWVASSDSGVRAVAGPGAERVLSAAQFVAEVLPTGQAAASQEQPPSGERPGRSRIGDRVDPQTRAQLERMRRGR